jgi:multiple sugar transport system substrate-binding protein
MKKFLNFALLLAMLLSACASATNPAPGTGPQTEVIWYVRANDSEQKWEYNTIIPSFEAQNPNIRINLVVVSTTDFDTRMQTMLAANTPPDIWSHWGPSGFQDYVKRGLVADLTPFIEKDKFDLSDFQPEVLDIYRVDGKLMGLPILSTGSFIFYNKDLFDQAGLAYPPSNWDDKTWTYDRFLTMCKALTRVTGDLATDVYGCNLALWPNDAYPLMWGQDIFPDSAYQTGFADKSFLNDPKVIAAFQAWQDIVWNLKYMPTPAAADAMGTTGDIFKTGKIAMTLTGGWGWWNYTDIKNFNWGVAALPYGGDGRRDVLFTDPWMLSAKTAHPNEAWTFLKFLTAPAQQKSWMDFTGAPPVRKSLAESWYRQFPGMSPTDVKQVHLGALQYGRESPNHLLVKYDQIYQLIGSIVDPVLINQKSAADTLPAAKKVLDNTLIQIQNEFK